MDLNTAVEAFEKSTFEIEDDLKEALISRQGYIENEIVTSTLKEILLMQRSDNHPVIINNETVLFGSNSPSLVEPDYLDDDYEVVQELSTSDDIARNALKSRFKALRVNTYPISEAGSNAIGSRVCIVRSSCVVGVLPVRSSQKFNTQQIEASLKVSLYDEVVNPVKLLPTMSPSDIIVEYKTGLDGKAAIEIENCVFRHSIILSHTHFSGNVLNYSKEFDPNDEYYEILDKEVQFIFCEEGQNREKYREVIERFQERFLNEFPGIEAVVKEAVRTRFKDDIKVQDVIKACRTGIRINLIIVDHMLNRMVEEADAFMEEYTEKIITSLEDLITLRGDKVDSDELKCIIPKPFVSILLCPVPHNDGEKLVEPRMITTVRQNLPSLLLYGGTSEPSNFCFSHQVISTNMRIINTEVKKKLAVEQSYRYLMDRIAAWMSYIRIAAQCSKNRGVLGRESINIVQDLIPKRMDIFKFATISKFLTGIRSSMYTDPKLISSRQGKWDELESIRQQIQSRKKKHRVHAVKRKELSEIYGANVGDYVDGESEFYLSKHYMADVDKRLEKIYERKNKKAFKLAGLTPKNQMTAAPWLQPSRNMSSQAILRELRKGKVINDSGRLTAKVRELQVKAEAKRIKKNNTKDIARARENKLAQV